MKEEKLYSIGEVAKLVKVAIHTIRFWTDEFPENVKPVIKRGNRRYYHEKDVETFKKINTFIHTNGIRIKSIRERRLLAENPKSDIDVIHEQLGRIKIILTDVLELLK